MISLTHQIGVFKFLSGHVYTQRFHKSTPFIKHSSMEHISLRFPQLSIKDQSPQDLENGWTLLHNAAKNGHFKVCKLIMDNLEDKNPVDSYGWTPLHSAAQNGHLEIVQYIMEYLEDKNPEDKDGWTPLHAAAHKGYLKVCQLIMENVEDKNGSLLE